MKSLFKVFILVSTVSLFSSCGYNTMVDKEEIVSNEWSKVESQYQRRSDLIPNLVNTVKGYAEHEQETLTQVMEARAKATSVTVDPKNLDEQSMQQFQQAQNQVSSSLSRLLVSVENYPDLKANQQFLALQAQLEGTENRIAVARDRFNDAVLDYNSYVRRFPNNLIAGMFGFEKKAHFEADAGAEKAPDVKF